MRFFGTVLLVAVSMTFGSVLNAGEWSNWQDQASDSATAESQNSPTVDNELTKKLAEWDTTREKLESIRERYAKAVEDMEMEAAQSIRKEFLDTYKTGNEQIDAIRQTALDLLKQDSTDELATKTLIGVLVNDANKEDNDAETLSLAEELMELKVDSQYLEKAKNSNRTTPFAASLLDEAILRNKESLADDLPRVKLTTSKGDIVVELFENEAPDTVGNFISLVESGYYNGSDFHRVMEKFMAQTGQPGTGQKELDYKIYSEFNKPERRLHFAGSLSMANIGQKDTGSGEFFITFARTMFLDGKHTVFGRVIEGMDVVNQLTTTYQAAQNNPAGNPIPGVTPDKITKAEVLRKREHEYKPNKVDSNPPATNPGTVTGGDGPGAAGNPASDSDDSKSAEDKTLPPGEPPASKESNKAEKKKDPGNQENPTKKDGEKKKDDSKSDGAN